MYLCATEYHYPQSKDMVSKMIEYEMEETFKSFGDVSELPSDLFMTTNCFYESKRPYYLGVDFARGNDWTGKIVIDKKGEYIVEKH